MEYTKGEWKVLKRYRYKITTDTGIEICELSDPATTRLAVDIKKQEANAHLIAQSPRMYEALSFIITGKREDGRYDKHDAAGFIKIAEDALKDTA